jgi:hypothetical protein
MRKKNKSVRSTLWRIHDLLWFKEGDVLSANLFNLYRTKVTFAVTQVKV